MNIYSRPWGTISSGETATLFTLVNDNGMTVEITDFGGTIVSIKTSDRNGKLTDICLGYDSLSDYEHADGYLSTTSSSLRRSLSAAAAGAATPFRRTLALNILSI